MRVLFLQDHLRCGGTEHQSLLKAKRLRDDGHEARVLTFRPGGELAPLARSLGVDHVALTTRDLGLDLFAPGLGRAVRAYAPDALVCMGRSANCFGGWLQARHPAVSVIGTVRTGKGLPWLNRAALGRTRGVIVNTGWWRDRLAGDGIDPDRIEVVYNAARYRAPGEPAPRNAEVNALRAANGAAPTSVVLINVAAFRPGKRQDALIEACAGLPESCDWRLWLVGHGPERSRCESFAGARGLGDRVRFFGFQADPAPLYGAADAAVSASVEDAMPNFLVEAQCFGLPSVAVDYRGVAEVVADGVNGYLAPPGADDALRAHIATLCADAPLRATLGRAAARAAAEKFDPDAQSRRFVASLLRLSRA